MRRSIGILAALPLLLLADAASAATLYGRCTIQASDGKQRPCGSQALLLDQLQDGKVIGTRRSVSDAQGNYSFGQLESGPLNGYRLRTQLAQASKPSVEYIAPAAHEAPMAFAKDDQRRKLDIKLYAATDDLGLLQLELMHIGIYAENGDDRLQIDETLILRNHGTQAFSAPEGLQISLPSGAIAAQSAQPELYKINGTTLSIDKTIVPGSRLEIGVRYYLAHRFGRLAFFREMPIPISRLGVVLYPTDMRIQSPALRAFGTHDIGGTTYSVYLDDRQSQLAKPTPALRQARFTLYGIPGGWGWQQTSVCAAMLAILAAAWFLVRASVTPQQSMLRQHTLRRLRLIEEAHRNGKLNDALYRRAEHTLLQKLSDGTNK